jgi:hypothetical protein
MTLWLNAIPQEHMPSRKSGARYFVRRGASTCFDRGFRSKAEVMAWFERLTHPKRLIEWRVGSLFRIYGDDTDMEIVTRKTLTR